VRRLLTRLPDRLAADGLAYLEIGVGQSAAVEAAVGLLPGSWSCSITTDLAGHDRIVTVSRIP